MRRKHSLLPSLLRGLLLPVIAAAALLFLTPNISVMTVSIIQLAAPVR